jgi:hypothetical protein
MFDFNVFNYSIQQWMIVATGANVIFHGMLYTAHSRRSFNDEVLRNLKLFAYFNWVYIIPIAAYAIAQLK